MGDEIYIDYGEAWSQAWAKHKDNMDQNRQQFTTSDMVTVCYYWEDEGEDDSLDQYSVHDSSWADLDDPTAIHVLGVDGSKFHMNTISDGSFWPCSILETHVSNSTSMAHHTVRIFQSPWHDITSWSNHDFPRILTNFPADSVKMFYKPYKSPMHSRQAFRQPVGIPSDMIPIHWRNTKQMASSSFRVGDRVQVKDTRSNSWTTGTVVVNDKVLSVLKDDDNIILRNIQPDEIRWATSHLMQIRASTHPFYSFK